MNAQAEILELFEEAQGRAKYLFPFGELSIRGRASSQPSRPSSPVPPLPPPLRLADWRKVRARMTAELAVANSEALRAAAELFARTSLMRGTNGE